MVMIKKMIHIIKKRMIVFETKNDHISYPFFNSWIIIICIVFGSLIDSMSMQNEVVMIGHENVPDVMTKAQIKQIFLGQTTQWDKQTKINFVLYTEKQTFKVFAKEYIGKTSQQYLNYWKKQVFTGKGNMPKVFDHTSQLIDYISSTKGAISFAPKAIVLPSQLKIITVH